MSRRHSTQFPPSGAKESQRLIHWGANGRVSHDSHRDSFRNDGYSHTLILWAWPPWMLFEFPMEMKGSGRWGILLLRDACKDSRLSILVVCSGISPIKWHNSFLRIDIEKINERLIDSTHHFMGINYFELLFMKYDGRVLGHLNSNGFFINNGRQNQSDAPCWIIFN